MSILSALRISRKPVLGFLAIGFFWGCFAASVPVTKAVLGVSDAMFGLLMLVNAAGLVLAMSIAPRVDRYFGARSMQVAVLLLAFAFSFLPLLSAAWIFGMMLIWVGFASGLVDVLVNTRVSELEAQHDRALMNANHGAFSVAYAISALTMGVVRDLGVHPIWAFALFGCIVAAFALAMYMVPASAEDDAEGSPSLPFWPVILCGIIVLIAFMTEATVETWSALHIERTLNGGAAQGALGPATLGLTMALGRFGGQAVSDRFSDFTVLFVATTLSVIGITLAALAPTPMMAYLGFGILGLGISVIGPIGLGLVGKLATASQRSNAISKASIIGFSGFFIAPSVMGGLSEAFDLRIAYLAFAVLLMALFPVIAATARLRR